MINKNLSLFLNKIDKYIYQSKKNTFYTQDGWKDLVEQILNLGFTDYEKKTLLTTFTKKFLTSINELNLTENTKLNVLSYMYKKTEFTFSERNEIYVLTYNYLKPFNLINDFSKKNKINFFNSNLDLEKLNIYHKSNSFNASKLINTYNYPTEPLNIKSYIKNLIQFTKEENINSENLYKWLEQKKFNYLIIPIKLHFGKNVSDQEVKNELISFLLFHKKDTLFLYKDKFDLLLDTFCNTKYFTNNLVYRKNLKNEFKEIFHKNLYPGFQYFREELIEYIINHPILKKYNLEHKLYQQDSLKLFEKEKKLTQQETQQLEEFLNKKTKKIKI